MGLPISITYTFGGQTNPIPLSYLDTNFSILQTAVNSMGNGAYALSNVTITGGTITGITPLTVSVGGTGQANLTYGSAVIGNNTDAVLLVAPGTSGNVLTSNGTSWYSGTGGVILPTGTIFNVVSNTVATATTITATIPEDDTIPQVSEGSEVVSVSHTATSASNKVLVGFTLNLATSGPRVAVAVFQGANANAVYASEIFLGTSNVLGTIGASVPLLAGNVAAQTYSVRVGPITAGTVTVNGASGSRLFGGAAVSSITVGEVKG